MVLVLILVFAAQGIYFSLHPVVYLDEEDVFTHEMDQLASGPILFMGDSTAQQIIEYVDSPVIKKNSIASNLASEFTGKFFLLRRFIESHSVPKAVVYIGVTPLGKSLSHPWVDRFFSRVFYQPREIWEVALEKRSPSFTMQHLLGAVSAFYRNRFTIQARFTFSNLKEEQDFSRGQRLLPVALPAGQNLSDRYLVKMIEYLAARGSHLYYVPVAYSESRNWNQATDDLFSVTLPESDAYMRQLEARYPNFHYRPEFQKPYPESYFVDNLHFTREALPIYVAELKKTLLEIQSETGVQLF